MPSFKDWLKASWTDFRSRWTVLFTVLGLSGAATLVGCILPFGPAALAAAIGAGPAWAVWGPAAAVAALAALWLSTWAQAAVMRAALTEEPAGECLKRAWAQTPEFAWVLSLTLLSVAGGYVLLVLPGLFLSIVFAPAPFFLMMGDSRGMRALGASWARVLPRLGSVALRVMAAGLIAALPAKIPYLGWLIALLWTPFGAVALARLSRDLRDADPDPKIPSWLGGAVAALSFVFLAGTALAAVLAVRIVVPLARSIGGGDASSARGLDADTGNAMIAELTGKATPEQQKKILELLTTVSVSTAGVPALPPP